MGDIHVEGPPMATEEDFDAVEETEAPARPDKSYYFNNEIVEALLYEYNEGACVEVAVRDKIMSHASELIIQIIRAHNLASIYPGKDDSSYWDLFQVAWAQIESTLYKYDARPHCLFCFNFHRPADSMLMDTSLQECIFPLLIRKIKRCPRCGAPFATVGVLEDKRNNLARGRVYYRGTSKVFNMWCVSPDTMVVSDFGITSISDVIGRHEADSCSIFGLDGLSKIEASLERPECDTFKIRTRLGYGLECTPEHQNLTLCDHGYEWKQTKNLAVGDLIAVQYDQRIFVEDDDLSDIILQQPGGRHTGFKWMQPDRMNEELAYIIGLFIAEGSYSYGKLVIYNIDNDVVDRLANNNLGLNFIHEPKFQRISLCNIRFIEFLQKLGFPEHTKCDTKFIPSRLLRCSQFTIGAMLSGMFDGDGHSSRFNGVVGYTSSSKQLIKQVRMLLLNMGILTKLSVDNRKTSTFKGVIREKKETFQLTCSTLHSDLFYNEIGFKIRRKQEKSKALRKQRDIIYGLSGNFRALYKKYGAGKLGYDKIRRVLNSKSSTVVAAGNYLESWSDYKHDRCYQFILDRLRERKRNRCKMIWLPITDIEESRSPVCEVSVDSETHSYVANGIVTHNSQVARTVILAHIKKESRDRKNAPNLQMHLMSKSKQSPLMIERFVTEAKEAFKYNDEHIAILGAIESIHQEDDRAHEGLVSKISVRTGLSRIKVVGFFNLVRSMSLNFSDSPFTRKTERIHKHEPDEEDPYQ